MRIGEVTLETKHLGGADMLRSGTIMKIMSRLRRGTAARGWIWRWNQHSQGICASVSPAEEAAGRAAVWNSPREV